YVALPSGQRGTAIMVQTTDPSPPRQLTQPPPGADDTAPAWSPNGRELAFLRVRAGQDCVVMVQPANGGGVPRRVGRCDPDNRPSFDWTPDGRGLIFSSRGTLGDGRGLRVLDLASGTWRPIEYAASAQDLDAAPRYSPDGRWIVFVRNAPFGDFWRLPATGGTAMRLTEMRGDIGDWDFTPDGRALVFARWRYSESRLYRVDLDTGLVRDLGIPDGDQPAIAARAPALAFSQQRNYFGLYRVDLSGQAAPQRLFPSSGRDRVPSIAPDGRQIAFTSDRSGQFGLWWADLSRPDSLRLIDGVLPESRHLPEWSPDSERLLVVGSQGEEANALYEISPASGRMARLELPDGEPVQGAYSPADARRLYVVAGTGWGRLRLTLYDRSASPWRVLARIEDVAVARVDPANARVLFTRAGRPGLWQADLDLAPASVRRVSDTRPTVIRYRQWGLAPDGRILLADRAPGCAARLSVLVPPAAGDAPAADAPVAEADVPEADAAEAERCLDPSRLAASTAFSVAPDGQALYVSLSETLGGDIGFMMLPESTEALQPRVNK
ncbi:MAG TPA: transcriptional regulator, partial [Lysobacter sp.]